MGCSQSQSTTDVTATTNVAVVPPTSKSGSSAPPKSSSDPTHTLSERYTLGEVLGEGGYSVVKLGISNDQFKRKVAVKVVTRSNISKDDEQSLRSEVAIGLELKHPNIVRVLDFFEEPKFFYIVLEYLDGGELFDRIVKKSFYNEKEARDVVCLVLRAIQYCHHLNIVHRDLKPENLLLTSKDDDADTKIADFGFAVKVTGNNITTQCGTPGYIAPEILENKPYGLAVDMWSFGVILYILLGGYPPFYDDNQKILFKKIIKGEYTFHPEYWGGVSEDAKDLIRGLLTHDPAKRLTVDQALKHKWIIEKAEELEKRNLDTNLAELRKYLATRKLKAGVRAIMTVNRMKNLVSAAKKAASENDEPSEEVALKEEGVQDATRV